MAARRRSIGATDALSRSLWDARERYDIARRSMLGAKYLRSVAVMPSAQAVRTVVRLFEVCEVAHRQGGVVMTAKRSCTGDCGGRSGTPCRARTPTARQLPAPL